MSILSVAYFHGEAIAWGCRNNFLSGLKVRDEGARTC